MWISNNRDEYDNCARKIVAIIASHVPISLNWMFLNAQEKIVFNRLLIFYKTESKILTCLRFEHVREVKWVDSDGVYFRFRIFWAWVLEFS